MGAPCSFGGLSSQQLTDLTVQPPQHGAPYTLRARCPARMGGGRGLAGRSAALPITLSIAFPHFSSGTGARRGAKWPRLGKTHTMPGCATISRPSRLVSCWVWVQPLQTAGRVQKLSISSSARLTRLGSCCAALETKHVPKQEGASAQGPWAPRVASPLAPAPAGARSCRPHCFCHCRRWARCLFNASRHRLALFHC